MSYGAPFVAAGQRSQRVAFAQLTLRALIQLFAGSADPAPIAASRPPSLRPLPTARSPGLRIRPPLRRVLRQRRPRPAPFAGSADPAPIAARRPAREGCTRSSVHRICGSGLHCAHEMPRAGGSVLAPVAGFCGSGLHCCAPGGGRAPPCRGYLQVSYQGFGLDRCRASTTNLDDLGPV